MTETPAGQHTRLSTVALALVGILVLHRLWQDGCDFAALAVDRANPLGGLALALLAYLAAHIFRFARFALLAGELRLSALLALYAVTTGASYAIPFKLGELFRIFWIGRSLGAVRKGVIIVWVERILDASIITLLYAVVRTLHPEISVPALSGTLMLIPLLIILSVLILKVMPENMHSLVLWTLRSYRGAEATKRLRWWTALHRFSQEASQMLAHQGLSLLMLSVCIWGLEVYSVQLMVSYLADGSSTVGAFLGKVTTIISPANASGSPPSPSLVYLGLAQGLLVGTIALAGTLVSLAWMVTRHGRPARTTS